MTTTLTFIAPRPGAWLREDIADILTALALRNTDPAYLEGLRAAALALGLKERETTTTVSPRRYQPPIYAVVEVIKS